MKKKKKFFTVVVSSADNFVAEHLLLLPQQLQQQDHRSEVVSSSVDFVPPHEQTSHPWHDWVLVLLVLSFVRVVVVVVKVLELFSVVLDEHVLVPVLFSKKKVEEKKRVYHETSEYICKIHRYKIYLNGRDSQNNHFNKNNVFPKKSRKKEYSMKQLNICRMHEYKYISWCRQKQSFQEKTFTCPGVVEAAMGGA